MVRRYFGIAISAFTCLALGASGGVITASSIPVWYEFLNKPTFAPPNYVFGPVWTFLYLTMGISFYLVWEKRNKKGVGRDLLLLFLIQLLINLMWSWLFFGLRSPELGFVNIFVLCGVLAYTTYKFYLADKIAGLLLMPYLAWVGFATILNLYIVILN